MLERIAPRELRFKPLDPDSRFAHVPKPQRCRTLGLAPTPPRSGISAACVCPFFILFPLFPLCGRRASEHAESIARPGRMGARRPERHGILCSYVDGSRASVSRSLEMEYRRLSDTPSARTPLAESEQHLIP